ncbi:MAG: polysaccharide biosynthesis tyrosine autokinase [Planctomycetes bacterium]|nr:polysaccharide biosynthesis tyrosine autokinase [Planctomycetota bacterium]
MKALQRRWLLAFGLGLMAALLLGAAGWVLLSAKYTAVAQVRVAAQPPSAFASGGDTSREFSVYLKSTASQIKGRNVIKGALDREEVRRLNLNRKVADPEAWLDDELKVEFQPENEWISVKLSMDDPDDARTILNAITETYKREVVEKEERDRSGRVTYLERIYTENNDKLRSKIGEKSRASANLPDDPDAAKLRQEFLREQLRGASSQHAQISSQLIQTQGRLDAIKAQEKTIAAMAIPEAAFTDAEESDPTLKQEKARIGPLKDQMKSIEDNNQDPYREPAYILIRQRIRKVEKTIEDRRKELRPEVEKKWRQKVKADLDLKVNALQAEIDGMSGQESKLKTEMADLRKEIQKIVTGTREDENLREEIGRQRTWVNDLAKQLQTARYDLAVRPRVTVPPEAALMARDIKKQVFGGALGAIAGMFGVCFGVAWLEFRRRRVQSSEEVSTGLGIRVVGAVPASPDVEQIINAPAEEQLEGHAVLESVDAIRTLLVHDAHVEATRVLMVTSAEAGEGKSTLASHLASSLSRAGRKTLLIDGDLRQPALHQLFEVSLQPGFSEVLLGEVDSVDAILPTNQDGLMVMPAGQWDREVIQSLARGEAAGVLEKLREEFDFVVVDSHPILAATDSLLIGQHTDAVILSLLRDVSQTPRVYAATQRLQSLGIRVLGAVVNGADPDELFVAPVTYAASAA